MTSGLVVTGFLGLVTLGLIITFCPLSKSPFRGSSHRLSHRALNGPFDADDGNGGAATPG